MNENIRIIEYTPEFAGGVAEMWNKSSECWGGYNIMLSAQQVKQEEENSSHLNLYLALDGDQVVGYCKLSEYREDDQALYIDLINVIPHYQKKKIGKALVLKCVERTCELGWPRLDLYTWTGNVKAVPLYKKCGFFWEDRDDSTHLMDFIPTVLKLDLSADFFSKADWYNDSTRKVEIVPDGEKDSVSSCEYYRYTWEKNGRILELDFCRFGRCLRRIEMDDLLMSISVEKKKNVFARFYPVKIELENKSGKVKKIALRGLKDRNIEVDVREEFELKGRKVVEGKFFVDKIRDPQSIWKTHPKVAVEVVVDDKTVVLGTGIEPLFPLDLNCVQSKRTITPQNLQGSIFLNLKNNFNIPAEFSFQLPHQEIAEFEQYEFQVSMAAEEKRSLKIPFRFKKSGLLNSEVEIKATISGERNVNFVKSFSTVISGKGQSFWGENRDKIIAGYGNYLLKISKREFSNNVKFRVISGRESGIYMSPPKLGKPYTSEFSKKDPAEVKFSEENGAVLIKLNYQASKASDGHFNLFYRVFSDGVLETWAEIINPLSSDAEKMISLCRELNFSRKGLVIPYDSSILQISTNQQVSLESLNFEKLSSNWMFSGVDGNTVGLSWDQDNRINFGEWQMFFEYTAGQLQGGSSFRTGSIYFYLNRFNNWKDFQDYLVGEQKQTIPVKSEFELTVNSGNPFPVKDYEVTLRENRERKFGGDFILTSSNNLFPSSKISLTESESVREVGFPVTSGSSCLPEVLSLAAETGLNRFSKEKLIFPAEKGLVNLVEQEDSGYQILQVDNGKLQYKCARGYLPGIYSLVCDGNEWLAKAFPEKICRSWWSDWAGGIYQTPARLKYKNLYRQQSACRFTLRKDNFGNQWQGTAISVKIVDHENLQGISWETSYLTMAGMPVLMISTRLDQQTGKYLNPFVFETAGFLQPAEKIQDNFVRVRDGKSLVTDVFAGREEIDLGKSDFAFGARGCSNLLQFYTSVENKHRSVSMDLYTISFWDIDILSLESGQKTELPPKFLFFTTEFRSRSLLQDLGNIRLQNEEVIDH